MILNARAENGSSSLALRVAGSPPLSWSLHRGQVERRGEVVDHGVEQGLHALVLEGGAAQDRDQLAGDGGPAEAGLELLGGEGVLVLEETLHQLLVDAGDRLDQGGAVLGGLVGQIGRDVDRRRWRPGPSRRWPSPHLRLHLDQVDDADEVGLGADRELDHGHVGGEPVLDRVEAEVEVGAGAVELVDEADPGHAVAVGLAPHRLGLGLHTGHAVEDGHRAVEHPQRALHLDGEVDVARGVDDVDPVVVPEAGGGGGGDGDAALLLLVHPVHGGGAVVDFTDLVVLAGVVEDALGGGGLAGVDMGHDADVAVAVEGRRSRGHGCSSGSTNWIELGDRNYQR